MKEVSAAFREWFGGSKVVDAQGKPLKVFHGTARSNPEWRTSRSPYMGGIYFGTAGAANEHASMDAEVDSGNPYVIPVFLSIQNPVTFVGGIDSQEFTIEQMRAWEAEGFDGVFGTHSSGSGEVVEYVAFRPDQILSLFSNDVYVSKVASMNNTELSGPTGNDAKRVEVFVPNERMGEFMRKIEVIQGQARKLDLPLWNVVIGDKEWRPVDAYPADLFPGRMDVGPLQVEGCSVSIVGHAPVLAGWRFLAKIEHGEGGNLVKRMVGGDSSPAEWHTCGPDCDHCGVSRDRKNTYMLQSIDTGEVKHVGSTCVQDFLGQEQRDPDRIAGMFDRVMELEREFEYDPDKEVGGGVSSYGVSPEVLMASVLKIVQEDGGYLSVEKAESLHCLNTGDRLRAAFWDKKPTVVTPDVGHIERALKVLSWLKEQKTVDSLWLRNIGYLADRPCITCKDAGLFASGYVAWNRDLQKQLRIERGLGDWIGEAGEKITKAATLERQGGFENAFGFVTILSFRDEEGNGMVWKTQSPPHGLVVGSAYHVTATVKAHGEYAGDKQTEIIRAKVAELELFSFGALPGFKKIAAIATADVANESGRTPLLESVWADKVEYAKVLLKAGADANQLNQKEVPMLAYAASAEMAQVLLAAGARSADVSDEWLNGMTAPARDVVVAAMPVIEGTALEAAPAALCSVSDVVLEGFHCGKVVGIDGGVVTQKINRDGDTVRHDASKLSTAVQVDDVIEVQYRGGRGEVRGVGLATEVDR